MKNISISILFHNTDILTAENVITSCLQDVSPKDIFVAENSENKQLEFLGIKFGIHYIKIKNKGFGSGHNLIIRKYNLINRYKYHLIINPDVKFAKNTIIKLTNYLNQNKEVGAIMPQVRNNDGSLQFARRCLPSPIHLLMKRVFPKSKIAVEYEIKTLEPSTPVELTGICGCFMILRNKVIKVIEIFDERFFMYFEDFDLARRIAQVSKVIYHPNIFIFHGSNREHKRNLKLFLYLIYSAFLYFNKWGYFDNFRHFSNKKLYKDILGTLK